ncbi:MAG: hypothetical protein LAO06_11330 [Acidobacteriia bacterium]|nr:hypothetical protein [Terriglobia bacterium]
MKLRRGKKWFHGEKKHIDEQKVETLAKAKRELKRAMEDGDERRYLEIVEGARRRKLTQRGKGPLP